jgi:hypothetical protein
MVKSFLDEFIRYCCRLVVPHKIDNTSIPLSLLQGLKNDNELTEQCRNLIDDILCLLTNRSSQMVEQSYKNVTHHLGIDID